MNNGWGIVALAILLVALLALVAFGLLHDGADAGQSPSKLVAHQPAAADVAPATSGAIETLSREGPHLSCEVMVQDEAGQPMPGAFLQENGRSLGVTDSLGCYSFKVFDAAQRVVVVTRPGFFDAKAALIPEKGRVLVTLQAKCEFRVTVVDTQGEALTGVRVCLEQVAGPKPVLFEAESSSEGVAKFGDLPRGGYYCTVRSRQYLPREMTLAHPDLKKPRSPGECLVPDDVGMTVVLAKPAIACVQVEGDEVVWHWFAKRHSATIMAYGLVAALSELRAEVMAKHPTAIAAAWVPPEPVEEVQVTVFLRHNGWRAITVPVVSALDLVEAHVLKVAERGSDQTGILNVESDSGAIVPLVATQSCGEHGTISVPIRPGEQRRVPSGQYGMAVSPDARGVTSYVTITPVEATVSPGGATTQVHVSSSIAVREVECVVQVMHEGLSAPKPFRGTVDVVDGGQLMQMVNCSGEERPSRAWLPMGISVVFRVQMLLHGRVVTLERAVIVTEKTVSPLVITLQ